MVASFALAFSAARDSTSSGATTDGEATCAMTAPWYSAERKESFMLPLLWGESPRKQYRGIEGSKMDTAESPAETEYYHTMSFNCQEHEILEAQVPFRLPHPQDSWWVRSSSIVSGSRALSLVPCCDRMTARSRQRGRYPCAGLEGSGTPDGLEPHAESAINSKEAPSCEFLTTRVSKSGRGGRETTSH